MAEPAATAEPGIADREADFVPSLRLGLSRWSGLDEENSTLTLSEVARTTGLAQGAARRSLLTLVDLGYVRVEGRLFASVRTSSSWAVPICPA